MDPMTMAIASTVLSAGGQLRQGKAAQQAAEAEAAQIERGAGQRRAQAQREAIEVERQGRLQQSRALAVAAASGGGVADPTVANLMADLAGETHRRRMVSLYEGEAEAVGLEEEAAMTRFGGRQAKKAGQVGALTTLLSGGTSMFSKYGFGGPGAGAGAGA